jgi:hypothetical protein
LCTKHPLLTSQLPLAESLGSGVSSDHRGLLLGSVGGRKGVYGVSIRLLQKKLQNSLFYKKSSVNPSILKNITTAPPELVFCGLTLFLN